ncbi:glyoxalase [Stackebrandtia soli]|uniref:glyoxalase n=1 Tax=Stackebrandtia soli TaxID=1892856 RepID=UPI0039E964FC
MYFALHHMQLTAPRGSEAVLRKFYVDDLGMTEVPKPARLAARGGCWFRLSDEAPLELHLGVQDDFRPAVKGHPGIVWGDEDSLRALGERLAAAGHSVTWDDELRGFPMHLNGLPGSPVHDRGMARFYVDDPHGNRLEFLAPVAE